jgi:hypothetical protein
MSRRSKKQDNTMTQYYLVIGGFVGVCVVAVLYVLLNPKQSFAQMPVIDDSAILVHNGQNSGFQRGENAFFQVREFLFMNMHRTGHSRMSRHFSEIPYQTPPTSLLANLKMTLRRTSFPRSSTGERSTLSACRSQQARVTAHPAMPWSPPPPWPIASASKLRNQFSCLLRKSFPAIRATTDVRAATPPVLLDGASARVSFLRPAILSLAPRAHVMLMSIWRLMSAEGTLSSTRSSTIA